MKINSFLGVLELRVGIFMLTAVFMTCGLYSLCVNMVEWSADPQKMSGIVILCFTLFLIWIWSLASYGAHDSTNGSPKIIFNALCQWTVFVMLWSAAFFLSKISDTNKFVCMKGNCPESLWLYNNTWNVRTYDNDDMNFLDAGIINKPEENNTSDDDMYRTYDYNKELINEPHSLFLESTKREHFDVNIIIVIFNVVYYLVIFIYGWFVIYGYYVKINPQNMCVNKDQNQTVDAVCVVEC